MIKFINKFDKNITDSVNNHQMKKNWWLYATIILIYLLFAIGCFVENDIIGGVSWLVATIIFFPLCYFLTKIFQKSLNNSTSIMSSETIEVYEFNEDKFKITQTKGEDYFTTIEAKYSYFYKVYETADNYFMYMSKAQVHVVPKKGLVEGNLDDLNRILTINLDDKFKPLLKNKKNKKFY